MKLLEKFLMKFRNLKTFFLNKTKQVTSKEYLEKMVEEFLNLSMNEFPKEFIEKFLQPFLKRLLGDFFKEQEFMKNFIMFVAISGGTCRLL